MKNNADNKKQHYSKKRGNGNKMKMFSKRMHLSGLFNFYYKIVLFYVIDNYIITYNIIMNNKLIVDHIRTYLKMPVILKNYIKS